MMNKETRIMQLKARRDLLLTKCATNPENRHIIAKINRQLRKLEGE